MSQTQVLPHVVYHVAAMGDWQDVVREQLAMFREVGLGVAEAIRVTFVGNGVEWFTAAARHAGVDVVIVRADTNTDHYETFGIMEVERLAKVEKTTRPILYLHTKGVSASGNLHKRRWRLLMEDYTVRMWRENVAILAGGNYDAVGVNWWKHGEQHFSGNVWMASADWVRRLPDYVTYHHGKNLTRYSCEMWIGSAQWCRAYSHLTSDQMFWADGYDLLPYARPLPYPEAPAAGDKLPLVVITACARAANLRAVGLSLNSLRDHYDVQWIISLDAAHASYQDAVSALPACARGCVTFTEAPTDGAGMAQKNRALDVAREKWGGLNPWFYFCDDDNMVHPGLGELSARVIRHDAAARVVVFGQVDSHGKHRLDAGPVQWGKIDLGSFMVRLDAVEDARLEPDPGRVGDDYRFIRHVWERRWDAFRFVARDVTYYNRLSPVAQPAGYPVLIFQDRWEWSFLVREVEFLNPSVIVEIGSFHGGSLWRWLRMVGQKTDPRVVSIDLRPDPREPWYDPILHGTLLDAARAQWAEWEPRGALRVFEESSHTPDLPERVRAACRTDAGAERPVDFLFIDGDHSREGALADFRRYAPLVRPGGIVAFHDVVGLPDVRAAWEEVAKGRNVVVAGGHRRHQWGIGIIYL